MASTHNLRTTTFAALAGAVLSLGVGATTHAAGFGQTGGNQTPQSPSQPAPLELGATGEIVRAAQQAMIDNGFTLKGGATGVFDKRTLATLKAFQKVVGIKVTGRIDSATAQVLKISLVASAPVATPAAAAPAATPSATASLPSFGARGEAVSQLQRALVSRGISLAGGVDGVYGNGTKRAVAAFQKKSNLPESGAVDNATAVALGLIAAPAPAAPTATSTKSLTVNEVPLRGQRGPKVRMVQQALVARGVALKGGVDGRFGEATVAALRTFQSRSGLKVTGRVDLQTGIELGVIAAPEVAIEVFPVEGPCGFADTWHAPRPGGRKHLGVDIIAREGQTLYAAISGTISYIYREGTNTLTGNGLRILSDDGTGTYVFYGHMKDFAPGIQIGAKVKAGDVVGRVGKTGTHTPHLHLEIHPRGGEAVNPYLAVKAKDACNVTRR